MRIENIIFDLGGVLIEWDPEEIIRKFTGDQELGALLLRSVFNHPDWAEKDRGRYANAELIPRFAQRTGLSQTELESLMRTVLDSLVLMPDSLLLMDELISRGYPLYCLSNMPVEHYEHLRAKYNFWGKFNGLVISGLVKMVKPEPKIYQYLLKEFQLPASTCVFIDDSPINIEVAQKVGMMGIVFTDVQSCRQSLNALLKDVNSNN
jgi:putative hydrolase of the HAD superfamily